MKFIAKTLLVLISIPVFFLSMLSINARFQFMEPEFWENLFLKENIYSQISSFIRDDLVAKTVSTGSKGSDIVSLTNLVSPGNLRIFFEGNIKGILNYANGKSEEITVYVPFSINNLGEGASAESINSVSQEMSLQDFLDEFNVTTIKESDLSFISNLGLYSYILTAVSFALLILIFISFYALTDSGDNLIAPGISFILLGILAGVSYFGARFAGVMINENYAGSANIGAALGAILAPPVINAVAKVWIWFGIAGIFFGILLFFIKKPAKKKV